MTVHHHWSSRLRVIGRRLESRQVRAITLAFQPTRVIVRGQRDNGWSVVERHSLARLDQLVAEASVHRKDDPVAESSSWEARLRVLGQQFDQMRLDPYLIWSDEHGLHWNTRSAAWKQGGGSTWHALEAEDYMQRAERQSASPTEGDG